MDSFWSNIFKPRDASSTRALLRRVPIFDGLSSRELSAIERILYRRTYKKGEVIFRQGAPGVGMYVIEEGAVAIVYEPTEQTLATLEEGDFFGEIALLNDTPRSATARASRPCALWGFFQPELFDLIERQPRLGTKLLLPLAQIAGQRLVQANEQVERLRCELEATRASRAAETEALADDAPPAGDSGSADTSVTLSSSTR